ncbi:hypothetical protein QL285_069041 [Trifolium repens]|nr:hypothetical protein QL285_069041 [Trifolium repens]
MADPPAQLNQHSDEPDSIGNEAVVAHVVPQAIDVAPDIPQGNVGEPGIDKAVDASDISVDTGKYFFNAAKFKVRDELIGWCKRDAIKAGFSMVIEKYDNGKHNRKPFFILGCEKGGVYKEPKRKLKREDTTTRKCECPFRLRGYFLSSQE